MNTVFDLFRNLLNAMGCVGGVLDAQFRGGTIRAIWPDSGVGQVIWGIPVYQSGQNIASNPRLLSVSFAEHAKQIASSARPPVYWSTDFWPAHIPNKPGVLTAQNGMVTSY